MSLPNTPKWAPIREIAQILARQQVTPRSRTAEEDASEAAYYESLHAKMAAMPPDREFDAAFAAEQAQRLAWIRTEVAAELAQESAALLTSMRTRTKTGEV